MNRNQPTFPVSLNEAVTRYLQYLQFERAYSNKTVNNYRKSLQLVMIFLVEQGQLNWQKVTDQQLKTWVAGLKKRGLKASTIQLHLSAIRGLFKFLVNKQLVQANPAEILSSPKQARPLPKNLETDEIQHLLSFVPEADIDYRDKAIMELFYSSGLRLAELTALDVGDIDLAQNEVRVTGKGNRERVIPVGRVAVGALRDWLKVRGNFNKHAISALFVSKLGTRLGPRQVQTRLKHWATKQGLANTVHPHKLRHSFATHVLESSSDLRSVQEFLGHANLSTTQIYTHLDFQHLAKVYDQAHPRAKKSR